MKLFGSLTRLINLAFRRNGFDITWRPNASTTYTAARDLQGPAGDSDQVLASATSVTTFTNKQFGDPLRLIDQNELRLDELALNGNAHVALRAPADLTGFGGSYALTLPLATGISGRVLGTDGAGNLSWYSVGSPSFNDIWFNAEGDTKVISHNLNTLDVQVEIYDLDDGRTLYIDSIIRNDPNNVTVSHSVAPANAWRVLIQQS